MPRPSRSTSRAYGQGPFGREGPERRVHRPGNAADGANLSDPTEPLSVYYSRSLFSMDPDPVLDAATSIARWSNSIPTNGPRISKAAFRIMHDQVATIVVWIQCRSTR